ncbi:hypothetical protein SAMN05443287_105382 [Micromonospora phaseoli]|uniref:Uncharacterized protein n=1 Tax=Micromonospora phaseoli TaxID=1144548 RepID=A0A1H6ZZM7_9ACTN|nr:hypothetical protein [Micromonospora phaseoli]PZV96924.1 hypothetical protein CLV64_10631 [Micromonospora phaseoli]GIJ77900.1 hypothetical protein Xph01_23320 [Micromonospora phaseoli]SEJ58893.1 hypothetical protein SAMN05443287_105382 [Micromonospora phaseoli]
MPETGPTVVLPGRPLTIGELLDSAVLLLRSQAPALLPLAAALAVGEQLLLLPLRDAVGATPPLWWAPSLNSFAPFWFLLALGAATEAMIILLLGNPAARAAGSALLGHRTTARELLRAAGARWGATVGLCALVGAVMLLLSLLGPAWLVGFALLGAVAPALVIDRVAPTRAIARSATLALRVDGRAAALRVLGYLVWWILRVGLGWGLFTGLSTLDLISDGWAVTVSMLVWAAVNAVAYAALACLDAVVHLETRIRSEGLDIHLSRAPTTRAPSDLLAVGG